jgi:FlaA1/EpsC-like NDP-sugar epimerase
MEDMSVDKLSSLVTKRTVSLFQDDFDYHRQNLNHQIRGSRILVIGGAGSVGNSTVRTICEFKPSVLHVVDQNENDLAELVRYLRNGIEDLSSVEFRTFPFDFGSSLMLRFLTEMPAYDFVLNFAALKHVRSEKDVYSLLQMFDVNLVKTARFLSWLSKKQTTFRYFCVSTDKAANPVNFMGASKRLMEELIFSEEILVNPSQTATSARFANVAFSKGSLLESFIKRMNNLQPIAAPQKTLRYFISPHESGHICTLAAFCAPNRHLLIPVLEPESDLIELEAVAAMVLNAYGLRPRLYEDESLAIRNVKTDLKKGRYPLLLTPLDTSGEKPYEEFVGYGEETVNVGMKSLLGMKHDSKPVNSLISFIKYLEQILIHPEKAVTKDELAEYVKGLISNFEHIETGKSLDERM